MIWNRIWNNLYPESYPDPYMKSLGSSAFSVVKGIVVDVVVWCRYSDEVGLEDAVQTAILTLKESFEGQMTEDNIEIGVCNKDGFRRLKPEQVKDYLAQA